MNAKRTATFGMISGLLFAGYALFLSRENITHVGYVIHLKPIEAETLFLFVDFLALFGKMLTGKRLQAKTRRIGYKWMIGGGTASLACNFFSGAVNGNYGEALYGTALVLLIVALEYTIANTKAIAARSASSAAGPAFVAAPDTVILTPRQIAARKGAATRKANREQAELDAMTDGYTPVDAPVSPAIA